jgi:hypothetical protein
MPDTRDERDRVIYVMRELFHNNSMSSLFDKKVNITNLNYIVLNQLNPEISRKVFMKKVEKQLLLVSALAILISGTGFAGGFFDFSEPEKVEEIKVLPAQAGEKKPFEFLRGDAKLTVGGVLNLDYFFMRNAVMLNKSLPDEVGYFKHTLDTTANLAYGEKKFGHKAVEVGAKVRFRTLWGAVGKTVKTESAEVKIGDYISGSHSHSTNRPLMWVKDAWLKFSLNAIVGENDKPLHFVKVGMFPFKFGRGVSLGPLYGVSKNFLATYFRPADYSAPGILFSGEILKDKLSYDLYYSKQEEKSSSLVETFNHVKENHVGRQATPWAGVSKDSDLWGARLIGKIDSETIGNFELEPYVFYNEASDQKVEKVADSKSRLGTAGFCAEYKRNNFELGGEVAFNFGSEYLYNIDRNEITQSMIAYNGETRASLRNVYSHITFADGVDSGAYVPATSSTDSIVTTGRSYNNSETYAVSAVNYQNASNRFRPAYKNNYRGWMALADLAYTFNNVPVTLAVAYGYASGDKYPNADEYDKTYKGFVGVGTLYSGKRVNSIIVLDEQSIKRPLTLLEGTAQAAEEDQGLSDLQFCGASAMWKPVYFKKNNVSINPNVLFFWKDYCSPKYDSVNNVASTTETADKYLGTECNLSIKADLLKDLTLSIDVAAFVPGGYYDDIKGTPLNGDIFNTLEEADKSSLDSDNYRLGNDTSFFLKIGVKYSF